jgi:enoyl-CoA hydratase/carnithine racemase
MNENLVRRHDDGPVAVLTLDRPDKRNALSRGLITELDRLVERTGHDPHIRAVVLTGAGTVFCAGMDLKEAARGRRGRTARGRHAPGIRRSDSTRSHTAQADDRRPQR